MTSPDPTILRNLEHVSTLYRTHTCKAYSRLRQETTRKHHCACQRKPMVHATAYWIFFNSPVERAAPPQAMRRDMLLHCKQRCAPTVAHAPFPPPRVRAMFQQQWKLEPDNKKEPHVCAQPTSVNSWQGGKWTRCPTNPSENKLTKHHCVLSFILSTASLLTLSIIML